METLHTCIETNTTKILSSSLIKETAYCKQLPNSWKFAQSVHTYNHLWDQNQVHMKFSLLNECLLLYSIAIPFVVPSSTGDCLKSNYVCMYACMYVGGRQVGQLLKGFHGV
jgi:hypothetical protein